MVRNLIVSYFSSIFAVSTMYKIEQQTIIVCYFKVYFSPILDWVGLFLIVFVVSIVVYGPPTSGVWEIVVVCYVSRSILQCLSLLLNHDHWQDSRFSLNWCLCPIFANRMIYSFLFSLVFPTHSLKNEYWYCVYISHMAILVSIALEITGLYTPDNFKCFPHFIFIKWNINKTRFHCWIWSFNQYYTCEEWTV